MVITSRHWKQRPAGAAARLSIRADGAAAPAISLAAPAYQLSGSAHVHSRVTGTVIARVVRVPVTPVIRVKPVDSDNWQPEPEPIMMIY